MNTPSYHQGVLVDPKFPPSEEYSQSNYISSDFFNPHYGGYGHQNYVPQYHGYGQYWPQGEVQPHLEGAPPPGPPPGLPCAPQVPPIEESPKSSPPPQGTHHPTMDDSDQDTMDDQDELLMMDDNSSPLTIDESSESGDRVIYPWMRKIHVAGVGKSKSHHTPN